MTTNKLQTQKQDKTTNKLATINCREKITLNRYYDLSESNLKKVLKIKVIDNKGNTLNKKIKFENIEDIDTSKKGIYQINIKAIDNNKNIATKTIELMII